MSEENISFYTKINKKKLKKGPILRVQFKKFQPIFTSNLPQILIEILSI